MSDEAPKLNIAILAMPEVSAYAAYAMFDLFSGAGRDWSLLTTGVPGASRIRPYIVATSGGPLLSANGSPIVADYAFDDCPEPAIVCVPDFAIWPGDDCTGRFEHEIGWLRDRYAAGATLAAVCAGNMLLAATGLLDGMDATIHWAYAPTMQRHYPAVRVRANRSLVISGAGQRIVMAGGGTSHMDLILYLIGRFVGVKEALELAKTYVINWHDAGQLPFASLLTGTQTTDGLVAKTQEWAAENYAASSPVAAMTRLSGLPERTFVRRFAKATGLSPLGYVHSLRLEEAKQMLETSDVSIEAIAREVGYEDASFFGRLFRRKVGLTPAQYRRRFGFLRREINGAEAAGDVARPGEHATRREGSASVP